LEPQWSRDGVQKEIIRRKRVKMKRWGLRMASEKVKRRGLHYLSSVGMVVLLIEIFLLSVI